MKNRRDGMGWVLLGVAAIIGLAPSLCSASPSPVTRSFTNSAAIQIPDEGPATPYPSTITVSGLPGLVTKLVVQIRGLSHPFPDDIDMLLVTPAGQKLILMADAGGSFAINNVNVTFEDGFPAIPNGNEIFTGTYATANYFGTDAFAAPAPGAPYSVGLGGANGFDPNGIWRLFVMDDTPVNDGSIDLGWSLTITSAEQVPTISIAHVGPNLQLSWPSTASGFFLEGRANLVTPPAWASVTNAVATENGQNRVTIPVNDANGYFRLRK